MQLFWVLSKLANLNAGQGEQLFFSALELLEEGALLPATHALLEHFQLHVNRHALLAWMVAALQHTTESRQCNSHVCVQQELEPTYLT